MSNESPIDKTVAELVTDLNEQRIDELKEQLVANEVAEPAPAQRFIKANIFKPSHHQRKMVVNTGDNMVFDNPLEAKSPQEILDLSGMRRRDDSMFPNNTNLPQYGDFSDFKDFGERVNLYLSCKDQFEALPSEVRREFGDDLSQFAKYVNSDNFDVTKIMSKSFRENYYEPEQRRIARDKAYADFLRQKQDEEMKPPI